MRTKASIATDPTGWRLECGWNCPTQSPGRVKLSDQATRSTSCGTDVLSVPWQHEVVSGSMGRNHARSHQRYDRWRQPSAQPNNTAGDAAPSRSLATALWRARSLAAWDAVHPTPPASACEPSGYCVTNSTGILRRQFTFLNHTASGFVGSPNELSRRCR